jgi:hypothetical protein
MGRLGVPRLVFRPSVSVRLPVTTSDETPVLLCKRSIATKVLQPRIFRCPSLPAADLPKGRLRSKTDDPAPCRAALPCVRQYSAAAATFLLVA